MTNLLRNIAIPLFVLLLALPFASKAGQAAQDRQDARPGLSAKAQHEAIRAESREEVLPSDNTATLVADEPTPAPSAASQKSNPRQPHPRRYADQKTTGLFTLGAGLLLLLVGILTNLVRGTTSAFMAMIAGLGTICLVLGALFIIVGIAILIAGT